MMRIISATAYDVDKIMPIMATAFAPEYGEAWTADQCRGVLALPGSALSIAYWEEGVAGFALWRSVLDEAELLLIATDPARRQSGIGTALLNHLMGYAKVAGIVRLHVEVRSDNPALHFYEAAKFDQVGVRPHYYRRLDGGPNDANSLCRLL